MNRERLIFNFQKIKAGGNARFLIRVNVAMDAGLPPGAKIAVANRSAIIDRFLRSLFEHEPFEIRETVFAFDQPLGCRSLRKGGFLSDAGGEDKAARIALASGDPVIPVGICHSRRAYSPFNFRTEGRLAWRGDFYVTLGQALAFNRDADDRASIRELSRQMRTAICTLMEESKRRMRKPSMRQTPEWMPSAVDVR